MEQFSFHERKIKMLKDIRLETKRFLSKLDEAILEVSDEKNWSHKKYASAKRSALDLKQELTNLTQDSIFIYKR